MITKNLNIAKSSNSVPLWAFGFSPVGISMFIDFGTPIQIVVPDGCNVAIFEYNSGAKVLVNSGTSAETIPAVGTQQASSARINLSSTVVNGGEQIFLQTVNTGGDVVTVSFYNNQENRS